MIKLKHLISELTAIGYKASQFDNEFFNFVKLARKKRKLKKDKAFDAALDFIEYTKRLRQSRSPDKFLSWLDSKIRKGNYN